VEILARLATEGDQVDDKTRAFADAQAGVEQEQDQQVITAPKRRAEIDHGQDFADFGFG
jgi:hypothetical protein